MNFPDSTFEVLHLANGQLKVVAPPHYSLAFGFLTIVVISGVFFLYRAIKVCSWGPVVGLVLWCGIWMLAVLGCWRNGSVTLDRSSNTAYLHQPSYFWHKDSALPLDSIRYARIMTGSGTTWIALVLNSGDIVSFSDSTDQGGKGRAAEAINEYLGTDDR